MSVMRNRGGSGALRRLARFGRRPRPEARGSAALYRDPLFADPAVVEDDYRRLRGPDE